MPSARDERVRINVSKSRVKNQPAGPTTGLPKADLELDDLELWGDVSKESEIEELPSEATPAPAMPAEPLPVTREEQEAPAAVEESIAQETQPVPVEPAPVESAAEPAAPEEPRPAPNPLQTSLNLSRAERIGLIALVALLLVMAVAGLTLTLGRLPKETTRAGTSDFPIRGEFVAVKSANSYWREPILDGSAPDTVRRGTRLLPVLELDIGEGNGVLRVLFRNEDRVVVGDAVTRSARGGGRLLIPATAGFEDIGMHAAYRTGQTRPWTIEVLEAPSEQTAGRAFKRLFEINISTDRR